MRKLILVLLLLPLFLALIPFISPLVLAQDEAKPAAPTNVSKANQACLACHDPKAETGPAVSITKLQNSPHKTLDCTGCHYSFTPDYPHTEKMKAEKAKCADCHSEESEAYDTSVHALPDKQAGDHPKCATCHGGGDPHAVTIRGTWSREAKVKVCSDCHANKTLMGRYGPNVEAVDSYNHSFHGKALLRFGNLKTAICADCHMTHAVLKPDNPKSSINSANIAKTCSQVGCHPGATMNFAMSGAGHMHLTIKEHPFLSAIELFFKVLTFSVIAFLLLGVAMDLRRTLFADPPPPSGRFIGTLVGLGFLTIVAAILMALAGVQGGRYVTMASLSILTTAIVLNAFRRKEPKPKDTGRKYLRISRSLRIQHGLLALSFTTLVITAMPIRYPDDNTLRALYMALGGMPVMRMLHRIAAVAMIVTWIYHSTELFVKWARAGFSLQSMTMLPTLKDFRDFFDTIKYHLGLAPSEPKFDRFQFREKFDYFAVYWGMPIMVLSGLILWFPVAAGRYLPAIGIPVAYIAHADESVLAFLTIVTWHFYNTHFNLKHFPMNPVFMTGVLTEEEMEREHPYELERIRQQEAAAASVAPVVTAPVAETPVSAVPATQEPTLAETPAPAPQIEDVKPIEAVKAADAEVNAELTAPQPEVQAEDTTEGKSTPE